jgi:hypothetical protein
MTCRITARRLASTTISSLLALSLASTAHAQGAGIHFGPTPILWIGMDRSASLDFTFDEGQVPAHELSVADCDPDVEYERNRRILLTEGFTGRFDGLCAIGSPRLDIADASLPWPHIDYTWARHRSGGLLHLGAPFVNFGYGSFDSDTGTGLNDSGGCSLGQDSNGLNLGVSNELNLLGGYVPPLPASGFPPLDGSQRAWRQHAAREAYRRILDIYPAGGTPLAATLDDIEYLRHNDQGVVTDPYNACRPHAALLVTDGGDTWEVCHSNPDDAAPELACDQYDYPPASEVAARLGGDAECRSCDGGDTVYGVPTFVVGLNVDEPLAVAELEGIASSSAEAYCATIGEDSSCLCAVRAADGTCLQHSYRANDYHALLNSLATVLHTVVAGGAQSTVQPQTMRMLHEGRPGIATFEAGAVFGPAAWATGTFTRTLEYCAYDEDDPDDPGYLAEAPRLDLAAQFDAAHAVDTEVRYFTNRLDLASSCARPTCDFHDPESCGDDADWVPDPVAGAGLGTGGLTRGGATPEPAWPTQSAALEVLFGVTGAGFFGGDGSGLSAGDIGEVAVCGTSDVGPITQIVTPDEADALIRDFGYSAGACPGQTVLCHKAEEPWLTLLVGTTERGAHMAHGDSLGVCYPPVPVATPGQVCHYGDGGNPTTIEVGPVAALVHLTLHPSDFAGACPAEADQSNRAAVVAALHAERGEEFWNGNDFELFSDPTMGFDAVSERCMVPLDVAVWREHPEFFAAENPDHVEAILRWMRGENLAAMTDLLPSEFDPLTAPFYDRPEDAYFGDILHGQMAVAGRPSVLDRSTEGYQRFVADHGARRRMVYLPNNNGQLMAFDAESGAHQWSFVPGSMLPALGQTMHARRAILDGPVTVRDMICGYSADGTDEYCTILALSYGAGGSGVTALDVTDPDAPAFLFELTGEHMPELGLGGPRALLTHLEIYDGSSTRARGVMVISGGVPAGGPEMVLGGTSVGSSSGEVIAVLEVPSGRVMRQFDAASDPALFASCGAVTSPPETLSEFASGAGIYAGTQYGCLLFLDTSSVHPEDWALHVIDRASTPGMILYPPAVARRGDGSNIVVYSQGSPEFDPHTGRIQTLVSFRHELALVPGADGAPDTYAFADVDLDARDHVNFELALEPGEVVTAEPVIADGILYFATWVPNDSPCEFGMGRLWGIDWLGNRDEAGPLASAPYVARADDPRIRPRLPNPDAAFDADLPATVPYVSTLVLASSDPADRGSVDYSVIYDVNVVSVPSCDAVDARVAPDGSAAELLSGSSHRELRVHMVRTDDLDRSGGWSEATNAVSTASVPFALPDASASGYPLDWGSIRMY